MANEAAETNGFQPAFPTETDEDRLLIGGFTKREAIAQTAQAALLSNTKSMQEIMAQCHRARKDEEFYRVTAEIAVEYADALLEALEK